MKKVINKIMAVSIALVCILNSITIFAADNVEIDVDGNYDPNPWSEHSRLIKSIETDTQTGNQYYKFEYTNPDSEAPMYFETNYPKEGAASTLNISGNVVMSFDINFSGNDAAVYLKQRYPEVNDIALRVCVREGGRLMYGTEGGVRYIYDLKNNYFYPGDKWYNVQILANITDDETAARQSIYVTDKETNELVAKVENKPLAKAVSYCNLLTVGASCTMYIDDIIVMNPDVQDITIAGNPYPKRPSTGTSKYTYYTKGKTSSGISLYKVDDAAWSLVNDVDGVSISTSGVLTVSATAPIRPIVLKAELDGKTAYYLLEIEK